MCLLFTRQGVWIKSEYNNSEVYFDTVIYLMSVFDKR